MSRMFCIPGIIFLFCAFVLSILVSISLPFLPALDIARAHMNGNALINGDTVNEIRFGVWAECTYKDDGSRICGDAGHGYSTSISDTNKDANVIISGSWTRGLAVHPVATAVTFIALLFSFSSHVTVTLIASILSFLAALLTLIAFAIDIALYAFLHHEIGKISSIQGSTDTAPGFWLTFVSLILLLLAGCTVCFGRRRDRMSGASSYPSYPMSSTTTKTPFWKRFRRN
ncbi:SUR7/PalI family-domain-containing protein [Lentinula edodes]|uniref:SUR7/PalI family-domain-containing protein n=1 Tax=Lentinula edodes TaxID=5353 RepID=UPI001E8E670F|nr:SUR7/PalI family-domain-containing protein [Lentinula edodes]KAH7872652.1 SUR7/PalI family-domain-containing protein [Lentinula edodes]KAJ3878566.1 SUR7/PalI family-domain-containing protein [Lentinula edodes]